MDIPQKVRKNYEIRNLITADKISITRSPSLAVSAYIGADPTLLAGDSRSIYPSFKTVDELLRSHAVPLKILLQRLASKTKAANPPKIKKQPKIAKTRAN